MPTSQQKYADVLCENLIKLGAFKAAPVTDSNVRTAIMHTISECLPNSNSSNHDSSLSIINLSKRKSTNQYIWESENGINLGTTGVLLTFLGETHNSWADGNRADDYLNNPGNNQTCLILERGMGYQNLAGGYTTIREDNLSTSANAPSGFTTLAFPNNWGRGGLSLIEGRNMVVAGYLAIWLSERPQNQTEHVVILFGQRHAGLVSKDFIYFVNRAAFTLKGREFYGVLANSID